MTKLIAFLKQNAISIFAFVALGAIVWFGAAHSPIQAPVKAPEQQISPVPSSQAITQPDITGFAFEGNANAPVTIVEYGDYQCPFCMRFYENTFPQLKTDYIDAGKVKFVWKDFVLFTQPSQGPDSQWAAESAQCANDQGKFFAFHGALMALHLDETNPDLTMAQLNGFAQKFGLNQQTFAACMSNHTYSNRVSASRDEGAALGIRATPSFWANGTIIEGAVPIDTFAAKIGAMLKK